MIQLQPTNRGFLRGEFTDRYVNQCSIQESSLATQSAIWLGVDKTHDGLESYRMHLTQEMVAELLPHLQRFVEHGDLRVLD